MSYRRLFLFVEGDWDERFARRILAPVWEKRYDHVDFVRYSNLPKTKIESYLRSLGPMGADYLFLADLDRPERCITAAKEILCKAYPHLDPARIRIACLEIEGWYAAGMRPDHPKYGGLSLAQIRETDGLSKESFESAFLAKGSSPYEARLDLLDSFDLARALERNRSLRYFVEKTG